MSDASLETQPRTGEIRNATGAVVCTVNLGQRVYSNLISQAPDMRRLLERCLKDKAGHDALLAYDIQRVLNKTR